MAGKKEALDEYEVLRDKIMRGVFHPKQRLVEAELAESLNTNRARIRRVLARLEHDGLVTIERYRGARVRMVDEKEAMEIFETRAVLEPYLVRQTVARASQADKTRLQALIGEMRQALESGNPGAVGRGSRAIREEMWRISGQQTITQLLAMLNTKLIRFWYRSVMVPDRAAAIERELRAAVQGVCEGSADAASAAMARYHSDAVASLQQAMERRASDDDDVA